MDDIRPVSDNGSSTPRDTDSLDKDVLGVSEKNAGFHNDIEIVSTRENDSGSELIKGPADKDDILTHTIHVDDDPSVPSVTFRSIFLSIGLALFGGTLSTIYYFKPQTILINTSFLAVVTYFLGEAMALLIPRWGKIGRFLNPHAFTKKEHIAIVIAANAASVTATGIEVLAAEQLYYGRKLSGVVSVFLLFSSQYMGYGLAGLMRKVLVFPKNMLWPANLPVNSMFETLHRPKAETRGPFKVFVLVFTAIFLWEIVPEWIMPILTGVSIFCLANQNSATFTNIFGGAAGDEGLGLFSICFDWQYISGGLSPLFYPMESLISQGLGICLCIATFAGAYYGNLWDAKKFPFLSQSIFSANSTMQNPIIWNQTAVIGANHLVNQTALADQGLPFFSTSYAINVLVTNMATTASITHLFLWYYNDMKDVFSFLYPSNLKRLLRPSGWAFWKNDHIPVENKENYDPHYKLTMNYKACPDWWYGIVLVLSIMVGLIIIYKGDSGLSWWAFLIAVLNSWIYLIIFGAMTAITGVPWLVQQSVQMIGGYIHPGSPVANMYYSLYGYNGMFQGLLLSQDLKLAQYGHLAPRVAFSMQMLGTAVGVVITYIMTNNIIDNQTPALLSLEGTNVWSGQAVQAFNSLSVTWGGLPHELFSVGGTYQWLTLIFIPGFFAPIPLWLLHKRYPTIGFNNVNIAVVILYVSWLCVGINSSIMSFFIIGFTSQIYVRKRYPNLFVKYNYIISAALDGGTSVVIFILSFAIFGAAGVAYNFPEYWGNNLSGNFDHCLYIPGA